MTSLSDTRTADIDPVYAAHHAPDFDHVMIDIESMSLSKHNALVLSVGLVEFDPAPLDGLKIGSRSLCVPKLAPQLLMGRSVTESTQAFWKAQKPEASDHWVNYKGERMDLVAMCVHIREFCKGKSGVWANGNQFDLANLEELSRVVGVGDLWHYQAPRDMRTFVRETPATRIIPIGDALDIPGVPHEPIYDCISQAWGVWSHWQEH